MTRQEFIDNANTMSELIDFARDIGCDTRHYMEIDERDEYIDERAIDIISSDGWEEAYAFLDALPNNDYDLYYIHDDGSMVGIDDDDTGEVEDLKDTLLAWCDHNDIWDEEEDEEAPGDVSFDIQESPETETKGEFGFEPESNESIKELFVSSAMVFHHTKISEDDDDEALAMLQMLMNS